MNRKPPVPTEDPLGSLTADERDRVKVLLATVSTQTLLHSLSNLCQDNSDTKLIISALLSRVPFEGPSPTD